MTNLNTRLRDADPFLGEDAEDASLSQRDALAIRRAAVAAAVDAQPASMLWLQPIAVAAMVVLMLIAGATAGRRFERRSVTAVAEAPPAAPAGGGGAPRQLQFATPGGTRIIWVFNTGFDSKEVMP